MNQTVCQDVDAFLLQLLIAGFAARPGLLFIDPLRAIAWLATLN